MQDGEEKRGNSRPREIFPRPKPLEKFRSLGRAGGGINPAPVAKKGSPSIPVGFLLFQNKRVPRQSFPSLPPGTSAAGAEQGQLGSGEGCSGASVPGKVGLSPSPGAERLAGSGLPSAARARGVAGITVRRAKAEQGRRREGWRARCEARCCSESCSASSLELRALILSGGPQTR